MEIFDRIYDAVVTRNEDQIIQLSKEVVEKKIDPIEAIEKGFRRGMQEIGDRFERLEIYLPEMIRAADIMNKGIDILRPYLQAKTNRVSTGKILLGTIQGDVHEIGKNIVKILLEGAGFEVVDLGKDVNVFTFIDKFQEVKPDVIGISALMTNTMENIPRVIENLKAMGLRDEVKIMVGGAHIKYWRYKLK